MKQSGRSGPHRGQEQAVHGVVVLAVVGQDGVAEEGEVAGLGVPAPGALDAPEEGGQQVEGQVAGPGHGAASPPPPGASAVPQWRRRRNEQQQKAEWGGCAAGPVRRKGQKV